MESLIPPAPWEKGIILVLLRKKLRLEDAGCSPGSQSIEMAGLAAPRTHRSLASLAGSLHLVEGTCQLCVWSLRGAGVCDHMAGRPKTTEYFLRV